MSSNLSAIQPLYAFVSLEINGQSFTAFDDGTPDSLIDFSFKRNTTYDNGVPGSEINITFYDDDALTVEDLIINAMVANDGMPEAKLQYGWAKDKDTQLDVSDVNIMISKYSLTFEGIGTSLTLIGKLSTINDAAGDVKTETYPGDDFQGKPSKIVEQIAKDEGWKIGKIEETKSNYEEDGETYKTYIRTSMTAGAFINSMLDECVCKKDESVGYKFFFSEDGKVYFISSANTSVKVKTISYEEYVEKYGVKEETTKSTTNTKSNTSTTVSEGAQPDAVWSYLKGKINNDYGVAGLMGNLYAESGINPTNLQNSYEKSLGMSDTEYTNKVDNGTYKNFANDSAGYGLAQWTSSGRKKKLKELADKNNTSIGNVNTQLEHLYNELSGSYSSVLKVLKNAKSVREASDIVLTKFEIPANMGESVKERRASYGEKYYNKYKGTSGGGNAFTGKTVDALYTAYYPANNSMEGGFKDALGNKLDPSHPTLAAPSSVAFHTAVQITGTGTDRDGQVYEVLDRGGAIKIENGVYHFDILVENEQIANEWGRKTGKAIIGGTYTGNENTGSTTGTVGLTPDDISASYEFYSGRSDSNVISFSPEFEGDAGMVAGSNSVSYSIDTARNEMIECTINGDSYVGDKLTGKQAKITKILGKSSSDIKSLETTAASNWGRWATKTYGATMEIMGDPTVKVGTYIYIAVFTKYGYLHHTSGIYYIKEVEDNISGGSFITSLTLNRQGSSINTASAYTTDGTSNGTNPSIPENVNTENFDAWVKKYLDVEPGFDVDNNGVWCVDVPKKYMSEVLGISPPSGDAKDWWNNRNSKKQLTDNFDFITCTYVDGECAVGDIGVRTSGTYGHIFVVANTNSDGKFKYYDQNGGGNHEGLRLRDKPYSSSYVTGLLRPKDRSKLGNN